MNNWKTCVLDFEYISDDVSINSKVWLNIIDKLLQIGVEHFIIENPEKECAEVIDYLEKKKIKYLAILINNSKFVPDEKKFFRTDLENMHKFKNKNIVLKISANDLNINVKKKFVENKFKNVIVDLVNYCPTIHNGYWKKRQPVVNNNYCFSIDDRKNLSRLAVLLKNNKKEWSILNSYDYIKQIPNYGITQNWRCKMFDGYVIISDASMHICRQRSFISPISIFDIGECSIDDKQRKEKLMRLSMLTSQNCTGCFQFWKYDREFWSELSE